MPSVASIVSVDIRTAPPANQQSDGSDAFSQLLQATSGDDQQETQQATAADQQTGASHADDQQASRTEGRQKSDRSDMAGAKTGDAASSDPSDAKLVKKPHRRHDASKNKGDGQEKSDAAASTPALPAQSVDPAQPVVDTNAGNKIEAPLVNAAVTVPVEVTTPVVSTGADTGMDVKSGNPLPVVPKVADAANAAAAAAATPAGFQIAAAGKFASGNKAAASAQDKGEADAASQKAVSAKGEAKTNVALNVDAMAAKSAPETVTQPKPAPVQPQNMAPTEAKSDSSATNVAAAATAKESAEVSATKTATPHDSLENVLAQHFSVETSAPDTAQMALPQAAQNIATTLTPVSAQIQVQTTAAGGQPVPLANTAIAVEIAARSKDGNHQFEIRLDPPELGRIDVKLDVDKNGAVNTRLTVDRQDTLDLLQRDSRGLERALQDAGLKTGDGNLEFSLRQQTPNGSFDGRNQAQTNTNSNSAAVSLQESDQSTISVEPYQWSARLRGGVDIRV